MINKKVAFLVTIISIFIAYEFSLMYLPDDLERPFYFRVKYLAVKIAGIIAKMASKVNLGTHASNIRNLLSCYTKLIQSSSSEVKIINTKIENVRVRIYEKLDSESQMRPVMVYFHGGGYSFGDLNTYDMFLIEISKIMDMVIISVDYRLAPEHPFPTPTEDCFTVVKYLLQHPHEFKVDLDKMSIAGDSAGGNAVAVTVQRMLKEKVKMPKVQILIYPWLQMFTFNLPSMLHYANTGLIKATQIDLIKFVTWYFGVQEIDHEIEQNLLANNHTLLVEDTVKRSKITSYLNTSQIPEKYRQGKDYYNNVKSQFPNYELDANNALKRNSKYSKYFHMVCDPRVTPLFADHEDLVGLPKSYFLLIEWDSLKDEGILYSERLRKAGVDVRVEFYEKGFHGIASLVSENVGYDLAKKMLNDLIDYLRTNL